jgi:ribose transport system substrate-binding protein
MKRAWALSMTAATALALAACGNSASTGASPSSGGGAASSGAASSGAATDPGVAAAQAYLATRQTNPTSIALTAPLTKKPAAGKLLVKLVTPQPVTQVVSDGTKAAAQALGWDYNAIPVEPTAEGIQKAFRAALELNPAPVAIEVSGYPKVTFAAQLAEAKKRGIGVISESTTDAAGTGDGIIALLDGPAQVQEWGKDIAAEVVADSNGTAQIAMFSVSAYPILGEFVKGFKDALTQWCPAQCNVTDVDQQATDIGTKTPSSVVSTLQRNPKVSYAVFSFGDMTIGVQAALKSAGLAGKVNITGETPSVANLKAVKDGNELAWTGFAAPALGWRTADAAARFVNGDDLAPASTTPLPTQVISKDNVGGILTDPSGYYVGLPDYPDQFKKLWQLG